MSVAVFLWAAMVLTADTRGIAEAGFTAWFSVSGPNSDCRMGEGQRATVQNSPLGFAQLVVISRQFSTLFSYEQAESGLPGAQH